MPVDDVVAELEKGHPHCKVLKGDDFYDLKQWRFNDYYQWLKKQRGITTREEEDKAFLELLVWCEKLREWGIAAQDLANAAVVTTMKLLEPLGGIAEHQQTLAGDVNLVEVPRRSQLRLLFARAIVDLCYMRGYIAD